MAKCEICNRDSILVYRSTTHTEDQQSLEAQYQKVRLVVNGAKRV